jgi:hypothetical protein
MDLRFPRTQPFEKFDGKKIRQLVQPGKGPVGIAPDYQKL